MKPFEKLLAAWSAQEPPYVRVVTHGEAEIDALEQRYGVHLPSDFRDYLLQGCSTLDDGGVMDRDNGAWWGLDRLRSVADEYGGPLRDPDLDAERGAAIFFADYAIWCMAWAICCKPGSNYGRVFVVSGKDRIVASNFSEFVNQYVVSNDALI